MKRTTPTKIAITMLIAFVTFKSFTQEILQPSTETTYSQYMDNVLQVVETQDVNLIENGILYDRVFPMANLSEFNESDSLNISNNEHFLRAWSELYEASLNPDFLNEEGVRNAVYFFEKQKIIQSCFYFER